MLLSLPALALGATLRLLPAAPPTTAVLSGHLDHAPAGDSVRLAYAGHFGHQQVRALLSPTGDFQLTVPDLKKGSRVGFSYHGQYTTLYLQPGDEVRMNLDFPRFDESLAYTGRGAAANNYIAQTLWKFEFGPPEAALPRPKTTATTTPAQLRQQADAFRQARQNFLATYAKAHPLPPDFRRNTAFDIDLQWATSLLDYPAAYRQLTQQVPVLPPTYFDFLQQMPLKQFDPYLQDRGVGGNTAVLRFLTSYGNRLVPGGPLSTDPAEAARLYAQATADFGLSATRELALFQFFTWRLEDDLAGVVAAYPTFRVQSRDSAHSRDLRQQLQLQQQQLLRPGQPAPAFSLVDEKGQAVTLADLRGKVVYLDFWGTWCGPCMREMPASTELRKQFEGRDVAFVYISVGDQPAKWQQVLAEDHLTSANSVHLRAPTPEVPTSYQVNQFPTYFLIGRDGRIISRRAPRPSAGPAIAAALTAALAR